MPDIKPTNQTNSTFTNVTSGQSTGSFMVEKEVEDNMLMDKETQIKSLKENKEALEGKIRFLQDTCRRAGAKIRQLEKALHESEKWKEDEVEKFKAKLRDGPSYEKRANDYTEQ